MTLSKYEASSRVTIRAEQKIWTMHYGSNLSKIAFLDATSHLYKRVCLSVRPSVGNAIEKMLENEKTRANLHEIRLKDASIGQISALLHASSHLHKRVCLSVGRSVGPSVRNGFAKMLENEQIFTK